MLLLKVSNSQDALSSQLSIARLYFYLYSLVHVALERFDTRHSTDFAQGEQVLEGRLSFRRRVGVL